MKIMIDKVLKTQNKTRYWLSVETGISYPTIMKLCNNKTSSVKFEIIEKICKALNATPNDIMEIE